MEEDYDEEEFSGDEIEVEVEDIEAKPKEEIRIVIPESEHITSDELTIQEIAELISLRIGQIEKGSPIFTDTTNCYNARDMAIKELIDRRTPLKISRFIYSEDNKFYYEYKDPKKTQMRLPSSSFISQLNFS